MGRLFAGRKFQCFCPDGQPQGCYAGRWSLSTKSRSPFLANELVTRWRSARVRDVRKQRWLIHVPIIAEVVHGSSRMFREPSPP